MVKLLKAIVYLVILLFGSITQQFALSQTIFPTVQSQCTPKDIDINDNGLIEICDLEGLNAIRYQLDGSGYKENATAAKITTGCADDRCKGYELTRDLDFNDAASYRSTSNKVVWTQGAGWLPIGSLSDAFSGRFEANGYIISNLYINREIDNVALFAKTASKAKINGLSLENINITGRFWVGGLVGSNEGIVINSNIEKGHLVGVGNYAGGLVGTNAGPIINSYADVRISGENFVGGLVGSNSSEVFVNNYAIGTIEAKQGVGGLVGVNNGLITAAHSTVKTIASIADAGGLVGINNGGEIRNSYATGDVIGGDSNVGGLVGINSGGEIRNSYATGDVIGEDGNVGGLVGTNSSGEVRNSYATGDVIGEDINVGGLVGISVDNSRITNSYAIGGVSGYANKGGLVGLNHSDSKVAYSYWDISTSLIRQSSGGIPKITAQLQSPTEPGTTTTEIYYQWSHDDWDFGSANQYPLIKYISDDDSLACSSSAPPNCNDLLPGQYARLSALLLADDLTLSPSFNPFVFDYKVIVDRQLSKVMLTPFLLDDNAEVSIVGGRAFNKNIAGGVAVSIPLNPPPQQTLIKIGRQYRINIVYRLSAPTINLTPPSDNNRVNEGDTIILDTSPNNNQADDLFSYQWTQLSDKDLLSEAVTNKAILEIEIPNDFVDANEDDAEVVLEVEVSHATMRVRRQIALTIVKTNNDPASLSLPAPILTEATLKLISPEVDSLIVRDRDGGGDASSVVYQWQYQSLDSTVWVDIEGANDKTYSIPLDLNLADYTLYRVQVDYRDGQNYPQQIVSLAYTFIKDIDKNDDGLIDINYLEDLDAIRYQLDGSGYRKGEFFAKLIAGCPIAKCRGYELTRDLDFQDDKSYRDAVANKARWTSGEGWQPIGSLTMNSDDCSASGDECFNGILEGNEYTISNLTINRPSADSVGLFAATDSAEIRNIGLINADIVGKNHVGGLVGKSNRSKNTSAEGQIVNSYVAARVVGISNVGGLVGWNNGSRIDSSYVVGDVYGNSDVGALIGQNNNATIERSYAEGVVVANANNAGGLVGNNIDGDINNSYAVSNVGGDNNVGGLVGRNRGRIVNCYAAGNVAGNTNEGGLVGSNRGVIENSYWDIPASGLSANSGGEGRTSEQLKLPKTADAVNPATYTGWSTKDWDFGSDRQYPTLKATSGDLLLPALRHGLKHLALSDHAIWSPPFKPSLQHYVGTVINDSEKIQLTPITLESTAHIRIYLGDGRLIDERIASGTTSSTISLNRGNTTEIVIKITATDTILYKLKVRYEHVDIDSDDDGFIDINNLAQLNAIRHQLDGSGYRESESAAKVTTGCPIVGDNEVCIGYQLKNDLDFSDAIENEAIENWQPIGTANNPFTGSFKGDGYKISSLTIDRPMLDAVGLFGVVDGTIDQVALEHVDIRGGNSVGGLVGINRGEIRNSFTSGRITGSGESRNIGGLVGHNASTATVVNSFSSAYVKDSLYIGGLVGVNDGNIAACYATGSVGTGDYAGGLVGRNMGTIENSYASGNVEGRNYVGGFVAWNDSGTIANSYAVGMVDGSGTLGGFAARNTSTADNLGTITYSYWDKQTTMQDNGDGGLGFNTATLKSFASQNMDMSVIYYGWDLNVWQFGENVYPTLKYIKGFASTTDSPACSDSSSTLSVLPRCNTVLSGQSLGLADLRLDSPSAVSLAPAFRRPVLYYRMTVYADTRSIRLTPITYSAATLTINADSSRDEIALGDSILLNDVGETLITIDVKSEGDRSVEYQIIVDRFSYLKQTDDIDADDDGLIEISFIEALDAIRYQLDGSGYREAATHIKLSGGCDEDGSGECIGYELVKDLDFNNDADYRDAVLNRVMLSAAASWQAIGSNAQPFVAEFNGNGHTISNLRINSLATTAAGLFGTIENTRIESVGLLNVDVTGGITGALVGSSKNSEIVNSYATGRVRGRTVGGLVGSNAGTIINSYMDVQVYLARGGFFAGGLVGLHSGTIIGSYAAGPVDGLTLAGATPDIGGLVGYMFPLSPDRMPTIVDSYASGDVSGSRAGGLVGGYSSALIVNSYSSGKVSANTSGGLIGSARTTVTAHDVNTSSAQIKSSYWDADVNGIGLNCRRVIEGVFIIDDRCDDFPVAQPKNTVVLQNTTATGIYEEWSGDSWNFGTDKQYPALKYIKGSDSRTTCRDLEDTPAHLPICGTLLSGQRVGLSKLELVLDDLDGLDKTPLSPAFRSSLFDYSLKTYRNVQEIQLIPSAYDDNATIRIVVDGVINSTLASGNTSGRIPLKQSGDTRITVDVETQKEESFQYRIVVSYYDISAVPDDIDADNDGLIELYFLEDVNAIRYHRDGIAYRLTSDSDSTQAGCPYRGCKGYELLRNLDFNNDADYRDVANKAKWTTGSGWSPVTIIGAFNGNGHTISNLMINRPTSNAVGLFGVITGAASIENIGLLGVDISGQTEVGSLVGRSEGMVRNSYAIGKVTGTDATVGGLVGYSAGEIVNSYASVQTIGMDNVGGLVGNMANGKITNCYAIGDIEGNKQVGGLVGQILQGVVEHNYAIGKVVAKMNYGGFAGSGSGSANYWDVETSMVGTANSDGAGGAKGFTTKTLQSPTAPTADIYVNWDTDVWHFGTNKQYPLLKHEGDSDKSIALLSGQRIGLIDLWWDPAAVALSDDFDRDIFDYRLVVYADIPSIRLIPTAYDALANIRIGNGIGFSQLVESATTSSAIPLNTVAPTIITIEVETADDLTVSYRLNVEHLNYLNFADGLDIDSDDDGLIEIRTVGQLNAVRYQLDGRGYKEHESVAMITAGCAETGDGICRGYELTEDLDFDDNPNFGNWQAIGTDTEPFAAVFKGNGHTISNLTIDKPQTDYTALFGATGKAAKIDSVGVVNVDIVGRNRVGGLVGFNAGGIVNSYVTGSVEGRGDYVGGLIGDMLIDSDSGEIILHGYTNVQVTGKRHVGGFVGRHRGGKIIGSYTVGDVTGNADVGGFIGSGINMEVENSYASGDAIGDSGVGGFVGSTILATGNTKIVNSYAIGNVIAGADFGGFIGVGNIDDNAFNYWNTDIVSGNNNLYRYQGFSTEILRNSAAQSNDRAMAYYGWDEQSWHFGTDKQYPVLIYTKGPNNNGCRDESENTRVLELPVCNSILFDQRNGLADLNLNIVGLTFLPDFQNAVRDYSLTVYQNTEHIQLTPTAYNSEAIITINSNRNFNQIVANGSMSNEITLHPRQATTITIVVQTPDDGPSRYHITVNRFTSDSSDIDADNDGFIDIKMIEELNAMRYQLDGSGYRESEMSSKITLGCPAGKCRGYELVADLDFNDVKSYMRETNQPLFTSGAAWLPIGNSTKPFAGTFKGNGRVISNLIINRPDAEGVGLFGEISAESQIDSVGLFNIDIVGKSAVGGLVGVNRGTISKIYTSGKVKAAVNTSEVGGDRVGGLVGENRASDAGGLITDSYANTQVTGKDKVGGLVGDSSGQAIIIRNSYAVGAVSGSKNVGGLVGSNDNGIVENSYWNLETSRAGESAGGVGVSNLRLRGLSTTSEPEEEGIYDGWSPEIWDFGGMLEYPALKDENNKLFIGQRVGFSRLNAIRPSESSISIIDELLPLNPFDYRHTVAADVSDIELKIIPNPGNSIIDISVETTTTNFRGNGSRSDSIALKDKGMTLITISQQTTDNIVTKHRVRIVRDVDSDNDGLIEIGTAAQFNAMRYQLDGSGFAESAQATRVTTGCRGGQCNGYELIDNIDLAGIDFEPIGTADEPFTATFDGNGYTISNLSINREEADDVALFTRTAGRINGVGLINANIKGHTRVGALATINEGTISNSYAVGTIEGERVVGGLVGDNENTIINSYVSGRVRGHSIVGGLAGLSMSSASINNSFTLNDVLGYDRVGGLVGLNTGIVADSYASGSVQGSRVVGGLIGENSEGSVSTSYATASVFGTRFVGGLIGRDFFGVFNHSYWDVQTSGLSYSAGGVGMPTVRLQSPTTATEIYEHWSVANWDFGTMQSYPILKYARGSDANNPACGRGDELTDCGTTQSYSLKSLSIVEAAILAPSFGHTKLNYKVEVDTTTEHIHLVPTAWESGTDIYVASDNGFKQRVPSSTTSSAISLKPLDTTVVTIDVAGDRAVQYRLEVTRLPFIDADNDIDDDDDGYIEIHTLEDLDAIRYQLDGSGYKRAEMRQKVTTGCAIGGCRGYELVANLDFKNNESYTDIANKDLWTTRRGWAPIGDCNEAFSGTFKANGYRISNLTINRPNSRHIALFGCIGEDAEIEDVGLLNVNIIGRSRVGSLVAINKGEVKDSYAIGIVKGHVNVGGLVGINEGAVSASFALVEVNANSENVGGLVGVNEGTITNCYATGNVIGKTRVGSLVGHNGHSIVHSYAVGELSIAESETNPANYLVGFNKNGSVRHSYWDAGDNPADSSISKTRGIGLATNALKAAQRPGATRDDAYYRWNGSVWDFGTANQYPVLKYEDGTLLPMQRNGLIGLVLSNGARLLPAFETFILNYDVLVDAGTTELQFTPTPNSADASMNIYKDGQPVQTLQSAMPVTLMLNNTGMTEIMIVVRQAQHKQAIKYKLVVHHLTDIAIDGIPAGAVDEGGRIRLDGTYRVGTIDYSYRWKQLSAHFLPPQLVTNQAILEFEVAEDLVAEDVANREIGLRLEVGAAGETLLAKELKITINKINNDFVLSPVASPTMHLSELTAPQLDLSQDSDGEIKTIAYQWQLLPPDEDTNWHDIEGASEDTYAVPLITVEGSRFRVLISYIDGQGYIEQDIKSQAYVYVDIDDDDDGLIEIHTLEDLNAMRYQLDGSGYKEDGDSVKITTGCPSSDCKGYELTRHLDFADDGSYRDAPANKRTWTTASGWPPIDHFNAIFKGNGYAVSNLYINRNEGNNVGLFHNITRKSKIDGIGLLDISIDNRGNTGGLVGINRGTITNSYVRGGSLKGSQRVGGLVGNNLGTINNSYTALDVGGYCMVGGLVGHNADNGKIVNSYAAGDVVAADNSDTCINYIGGLVGDATGAIKNSYAVGAVSANSDDDVLGGLVARHDDIKKINDSYWDGTVNADTDNSYGTSKTTAELQTPTTATGIYKNWSDENWDFGTAEQYPALKYECSQATECGVVLPYQGSSSLLAQLILSAGLSLSPTFDPNVFYYRVQVENFNASIGFTPYVANINTKIKVTKNGETVNDKLSSGKTVSVPINASTKTTIVLETVGVAGARGVRYTLHINIPPMITIADEQQHISVDEGDDIILSAVVDDINKADMLRYNWMQLSGPPLLSFPQTDTDLVITVPHDLIDRDEQSSRASFVLEVSDGLASDSIRVSVKISKRDNDVIAALASVPTWLDAYKVEAAEIDLSDDSDGTGDNRDITYQWQEMSDGNWQDIAGATKQSYRLATGTTNGSQYRVTVGYTDGQGYSAYLNSSPTAFILDVDRDDDGLIEISDLEGLNAMRYNLAGTGYREDEATTPTTTGCPVTDGTMKCKGYELTRDLDFADDASYRSAQTNRAVWTTGEGWKPIGIFERRDSQDNKFFAAVFEGNRHTISNLYMNRNADGGGLFGATSNAAEIRDMGLLNVDVTSIYHVGGLVGYDAGSRIINSYVIGGRVFKDDSDVPFFGQYLGGLIGYKIGGTIANSYVTGISQVSGRQFIGGLVGDNTGGTITDSYASIIGEVSGKQHIGGLVGNDVGGMIMNSYAIGAVDGLTNVGGLVGSIAADSRIIGSYWDTTVSGIIGSTNGEGLPTAQLQLPVAPGTTMTDVYYDWHESDWDFGNQRQYPALKYLCIDPSQRPNCGSLLPDQRTGLFDIALGKGAVLSPLFDYKRHNYSVTIHSDTTQLKLTPIANDPTAVVLINDRFEVASGDFSPPLIVQKNTNTVITLRVTADNSYNEKFYELTVNNRFTEVMIDGIPQGAVDEGTTVNLDVSVYDDEGDVLRYRWSDLSGLGILSDVNTLSGVIQDQDDADISFRIADDLLDATQDSIDITLLLTVDDGSASVAKKVPLTINKHNNFISGSFRTILQGLTYTAPDIDLNLDADGVHPNPRLRYQWQQLIGGQELDIIGATDKTYIVGDFINPYHRVLISYIDGQAHEHTIESLPRSFAALSADDNNPSLTSLSIVAGGQTQTIELEEDRREYGINIDDGNISQITVIAEAETDVGIGVNNEAIVNGSFRNIRLDDDGETIITVKVDGDPRLYIITVESPTKTHVYLRVFPEGLLLR